MGGRGMKVKKHGRISIVNVPDQGVLSYGVYDIEQDAIDEGQIEYGDYVVTIQIEWED